jgi:hypothetical protein
VTSVSFHIAHSSSGILVALVQLPSIKVVILGP